MISDNSIDKNKETQSCSKDNFIPTINNSNLTTLQKQAYLCLILEDEEKQLESKISVYKDFLFEQKLFQNIRDITCKINDDIYGPKIAFSSVNAKKSNFILKYCLIREYNTLQKHFRIWKNSDWKYRNFEEIIEQYNEINFQIEGLLTELNSKKKEFLKKYNDYEIIKTNLCSDCLNINVDIEDEANLSIFNETNEKEIDEKENNKSEGQFSSTKKLVISDSNAITNFENLKKDFKTQEVNIFSINEVTNSNLSINNSDVKNNKNIQSEIEQVEKNLNNLNNDFKLQSTLYDELKGKKEDYLKLINAEKKRLGLL